jgi:hypothetical protein
LGPLTNYVCVISNLPLLVNFFQVTNFQFPCILFCCDMVTETRHEISFMLCHSSVFQPWLNHRFHAHMLLLWLALIFKMLPAPVSWFYFLMICWQCSLCYEIYVGFFS